LIKVDKELVADLSWTGLSAYDYDKRPLSNFYTVAFIRDIMRTIWRHIYLEHFLNYRCLNLMRLLCMPQVTEGGG
jgi:hypothetical protein